MYSSSLGNRVVNENDLYAASIVACRKKHTVAVYTRNSRGSKVCDNDDLSANQLVCLVIVLNAGYDNSLVNSVEESELVAGMRLSDLLALDNLAYTKIKLAKVVNGCIFFLDRLNGIGFAVNLFL